MYGFKAFYKGKEIEVYAKSAYEAQKLAAKQFKAKREWEVHVIVCENEKGEVISHSTAEF